MAASNMASAFTASPRASASIPWLKLCSAGRTSMEVPSPVCLVQVGAPGAGKSSPFFAPAITLSCSALARRALAREQGFVDLHLVLGLQSLEDAGQQGGALLLPQLLAE